MRRGIAVRLLLAVLVGAGAAACAGEPAGSLAPNGMMTVEQVRLEIEATKARIPLPEGAVWREIELGPGTYEAYSGGSMIEFQAMCAWLIEAREARSAGDQARFGKAIGVLQQVPGWRIFTDPAQMDDDTRVMLGGYVRSAIEGDFAPAGPFIQANCL